MHCNRFEYPPTGFIVKFKLRLHVFLESAQLHACRRSLRQPAILSWFPNPQDYLTSVLNFAAAASSSSEYRIAANL